MELDAPLGFCGPLFALLHDAGERVLQGYQFALGPVERGLSVGGKARAIGHVPERLLYALVNFLISQGRVFRGHKWKCVAQPKGDV